MSRIVTQPVTIAATLIPVGLSGAVMYVGDIGVQFCIPASVIQDGAYLPLTGYDVNIVARNRLGEFSIWPGAIGDVPLLTEYGAQIADVGFWAHYTTLTADDVDTNGDLRLQVIASQAVPIFDVASGVVIIRVEDRLTVAL